MQHQILPGLASGVGMQFCPPLGTSQRYHWKQVSDTTGSASPAPQVAIPDATLTFIPYISRRGGFRGSKNQSELWANPKRNSTFREPTMLPEVYLKSFTVGLDPITKQREPLDEKEASVCISDT